MSGTQRVIQVPAYALIVAIAVSLLSPFLALAAALTISGRSLAESERKWCAIVATIDGSYRESPPQTPTGRKLAEDMAALRRQLNCPA